VGVRDVALLCPSQKVAMMMTQANRLTAYRSDLAMEVEGETDDADLTMAESCLP
jgi:phage-related baseplate assembly protein